MSTIGTPLTSSIVKRPVKRSDGHTYTLRAVVRVVRLVGSSIGKLKLVALVDYQLLDAGKRAEAQPHPGDVTFVLLFCHAT